MSDVLKGSLGQLPLPEVLRLLVSGRQTGRLDIRDGGKKGMVQLRDGRLVHAAQGPNMGITALNTLTAWPCGEFNFVADAPSTEESIHAETDELLMDSARRADQWRQIRSDIPTTDVVFRFSQDGMVNAINLEPDDWRVLAQVNGAVSVADIANLMSQDELTVAQILARLARAGLLQPTEKPKPAAGPTVDVKFFGTLNTEFVDIMGPLAPMIIDECVAALGESRSAFPRHKVGLLIERIGSEIDTRHKRERFQQMMLDLLKKL